MKLLRADGEACEFRLGRREKQLFCALLRRYPLTPLEHHRLMRHPTTPADEPHQAWLVESMAAHRDEARRRLDAFLADEHRFETEADGVRLRVTREEAEWLLQILNDLRVGSWLRLGRPDPDAGRPPQLTAKTIRYLPLMELAGAFEFELLAALDGRDGAGWAKDDDG